METASFQNKMISYYREHGRNLPWREQDSDFHVLAALIMLQRTSVEQVANVYPSFCEQYPEPAEVIAADDTELTELLAGLGLPNRVEYLNNVATFFTKKQPMTQDTLLDVKGVGRYTANAFLSIHKRERYPIVDVNVEQVFNAFFDTADQDVWTLAWELLPEEEVRAYNLGLIDYGATALT